MSLTIMLAVVLLLVGLTVAGRTVAGARHPGSSTLGPTAIVSEAIQRIGPSTPVEQIAPDTTVDAATPEIVHAPESRFSPQPPARPEFEDVVTTTGPFVDDSSVTIPRRIVQARPIPPIVDTLPPLIFTSPFIVDAAPQMYRATSRAIAVPTCSQRITLPPFVFQTPPAEMGSKS
jgi:hypothetical protein